MRSGYGGACTPNGGAPLAVASIADSLAAMSRKPFFSALFALFLAVAAPARAYQPELQQRVAAELAEAPAGARFGLVVAAEDGRELIAINPDGRFIPASNTKLLTTAAAFATMPGLDRPDEAGGAEVRLAGRDVILTGRGDARLSSAPDCVENCLAALADAVAARTRRVRNIIGDDSLLPDQRWGLGVSWEDLQTRYGTAMSALTLDDNLVEVRVSPGEAGRPPRIDGSPYFEVRNGAVTVAEGEGRLRYERLPGSRIVYLSGTIGPATPVATLRLGIDDPAHYAAWRLGELLKARGVRVTGRIEVRHRLSGTAAAAGGPAMTPPLARLVPPPLVQDLTRINKESQNLHADLLLRRVGRVRGAGTIADGVAEIGTMLRQAGVPRVAWDLSDGSGMSVYNRLSPRSVVALLRWGAAQSWGQAWRETFPVAGVDGTLGRRFRGTPLERRLFAKTGTLSGTNALSGYMIARSGRLLTFSFFANDVPGGASATAKMDEVLNLIAAEN
jgi:serine-type D-Ala-D-Ala carboxypeptidase/endopeptidase (penicillin-binding protein 4)